MREFIRKILIYVLLPLIAAIPIDIMLSNVMKGAKVFPCENEVLNDIYDSNIDAEVAILGSSRAWVHFNPMIIEDSLRMSCYNLGEDGSNIIQQYLRFKEYIEFNPLPEIVVFSVDHITLKQNSNGYPTVRYYPYIYWNMRMQRNLSATSESSGLTDFYVPLVRYFKSKELLKGIFSLNNKYTYSDVFRKSFDLNDEGDFRKKGFRGMELSWNDDEYTELEMMFPIDSNLLLLFEKFITELKDRNIEVYLVYTPEYEEGQRIIANKSEIISTYEEVSKKYGVYFMDFSNDRITTKKEMFYNVVHLNAVGSRIFTSEFSEKLKRIRVGRLQQE